MLTAALGDSINLIHYSRFDPEPHRTSGLTPNLSQWSCKQAACDHTDLFDKKICKGQDYYRLSMGDSRDNDAMLSHQSMQLFLFLFFAPRPYWEQEVGKMIDGRFDQVRRTMDNLRSL